MKSFNATDATVRGGLKVDADLGEEQEEDFLRGHCFFQLSCSTGVAKI